MSAIAHSILLDFDGTLVESIHLIRKSYDDILKTYDKVGSDHDFHELCGPPTRLFLANILKKYNLPTTVENLWTLHDKNLIKFYQGVSPIPHALDLIKTAAHRGWRVGIVTSNNRNLIEQWIFENMLTPYISFIVDGESIKEGKPHPDPYLKALALSNCQPEHSLAVEDSLTGASSALAAQIPTFLLASFLSFTQKKEIEKNFPSLKIIASLKDVINRIS